MNVLENAIKEPVAHINQIRELIDRLKAQAKEKYKQDIALSETELEEVNYDTSYLRGYYFGQVAALEDCYHLMIVLVEGMKSANSIEKKLILQQLSTSVTVVQRLVNAIECYDFENNVDEGNLPGNLASAQEYLTSLKDTLDGGH